MCDGPLGNRVHKIDFNEFILHISNPLNLRYASGHNYNFPVLFDYDKAYKHTVAAKQLAEQKGVSITELEKGLIDSLQLRYEENMLNPEEKPKEAAAQIARLQVDYASSMRAVYKKFGENPHVAAFFAEQLMNRKPWELWVPDQKTGDIPTFTLEARDVLARSLKDYPNHPGLCHLYCIRRLYVHRHHHHHHYHHLYFKGSIYSHKQQT